MIDLVLDHKWAFLVGSEVAFWLLAGSFLVLRYWLNSRGVGSAVLALIGLNELLVAALGLLDYRRTGEFAGYQVVVLAFVVYAVTSGKGDLRRLDARIGRTVAAWRGQNPVAPPSPAPALARSGPSGTDHAREARRGWYGHVAIFVLGQAVFLLMGESWPAMVLTGELPPSALWTGRWPGEETSALALASRVWCVVLVVDGVWSLSYTLYPKREGMGAATRGFRRG